MSKNNVSHAFTLKHNGISRSLVTKVVIAPPYSEQTKNISRYEVNGIWDTGATGTVITQKVVDALGLSPISIENVYTASGPGQVPAFLVDVFLKHDLCVTGVKVTLGNLHDGADCLIGMDIISLGDFSVTNFNGCTCMSFRLPSSHEVDFVSEANKNKSKSKTQDLKEQRNRFLKRGKGK